MSAETVIGATVDIYGDGAETGIVESFGPRGVTITTPTGVVASSCFTGLYARVAEMAGLSM